MLYDQKFSDLKSLTTTYVIYSIYTGSFGISLEDHGSINQMGGGTPVEIILPVCFYNWLLAFTCYLLAQIWREKAGAGSEGSWDSHKPFPDTSPSCLKDGFNEE